MASLATTLVVLFLVVAGVSATVEKSGKRVGDSRKSSPIAFRPVSGETCVAAKVSFEHAADGSPLPPGSYVENEWKEYGLTLSALGGFGGLPRLFDTSVYRYPGSEGSNTDLGAPNQACEPPGPGIGEGGAPGMEGENCEPLGNVLIVQAKGVDAPDDSGPGSVLVFDFAPPGAIVHELGLLGIDRTAPVIVTHETESGEFQKRFNLRVLGSNSKQTLEINLENVKQVILDLSGNGAVTFISFCSQTPTTTTSQVDTLCIDCLKNFNACIGKELKDYSQGFQSKAEGRVVGRINDGFDAPAGRYPYYTKLEIEVSDGRIADCGGTLIWKDMILTAAHCAVDLEIYRIYAWVGLEVDDASGKANAEYRIVEEWFPHPDFDTTAGTLKNDIMILKLTEPVLSVQPILVNFNPPYPLDFQRVETFGFGVVDNTFTSPKNLQTVNLRVTPFEVCNAEWNEFYYMYESVTFVYDNEMICAAGGIDKEKVR